MTPRYRDLQIGGRSLPARFLKEGEGDPLLYLHGAIGSKGWNPSLDILAREYTVYAPLQPGFEEAGRGWRRCTMSSTWRSTTSICWTSSVWSVSRSSAISWAEW